MACGGCAKRRAVRTGPPTAENLMGGYQHLSARQLRARLEVYKRNNCKHCNKRYECDYGMFVACKNAK